MEVCTIRFNKGVVCRHIISGHRLSTRPSGNHCVMGHRWRKWWRYSGSWLGGCHGVMRPRARHIWAWPYYWSLWWWRWLLLWGKGFCGLINRSLTRLPYNGFKAFGWQSLRRINWQKRLTLDITIEVLLRVRSHSIPIGALWTSTFGCGRAITLAWTAWTGYWIHSWISLTGRRILIGCVSRRFYALQF